MAARSVLALIALVILAACKAGSMAVPELDTLTAQARATETLDRYYRAAATADFERWIDQFSQDARFYGTDATEDWDYAAFADGVRAGFEAGRAWDFTLLDRRVTVAADGQTAWFVERAHFNTTDYTTRPSGVLVLEDGEWKIAQLVMGVPFPNAIYDPMRMALQVSETGLRTEAAAVEEILDQLHIRASGGDVDAYFALYTQHAMFFGTDETERWTMDAFREYAEPAFADGEGWTYRPIQREIEFAPMGNVAWFDEVLDHDRYPNTRGSGVLVRTDEGWRIAQYNLTFLIPNDAVPALTDLLAAPAGE